MRLAKNTILCQRGRGGGGGGEGEEGEEGVTEVESSLMSPSILSGVFGNETQIGHKLI